MKPLGTIQILRNHIRGGKRGVLKRLQKITDNISNFKMLKKHELVNEMINIVKLVEYSYQNYILFTF